MALETQSLGSGREGHDAGWENITTNVMSWAEGWSVTVTRHTLPTENLLEEY